MVFFKHYFIYKLILLIEKLRSKNLHLCIVTISNKILSDFDLDDRVLSRIGTSEVFFDSYSSDDVFKILKSRTAKAFSYKVPDKILRYCAKISSTDHGDARRAIDLLRIGAEIAGQSNSKLEQDHIDEALSTLQQDSVTKIIDGGSYHFKLACAALARVTFLSDEPWHSTSTLFKQYEKVLSSNSKSLSYRRVSELLVELVNSGIAESHTGSKGRRGYGSQFRLLMSPEIVGHAVSEEWWETLVNEKQKHKSSMALNSIGFAGKRSDLLKTFEKTSKQNWDRFVGNT